MRLAWTTDLHLDHAPVQAWERWMAEIADARVDALLLTGDISEGDDVPFQLRRIAETTRLSIHFILGNHDFYESSIAATRRRVIDLAREVPLLSYLTDAEPIPLGPRTYLVGDDGWGDGTVGLYDQSPVRLNDFQRIDDFRNSDPSLWRSLLAGQGKESAERLRQKLRRLPAGPLEVLVATHVPPFRESCWYEGHTTDDLWAPFFVCGAVGETLREASEHRADCRLTVLCGHTHHGGVANLAENLRVHTGPALYGQPRVCGVIDCRDDGPISVEPR